MGKFWQFTYNLTLSLTCVFERKTSGSNTILSYYVPISYTQKFKLLRKGRQFSYTLTKIHCGSSLINAFEPSIATENIFEV
jgi:hypothetical protein